MNVWIWLGSVGQGCFYVVLRSKKSRGSLLELPLSCNTVGSGIGAKIPLSGQTVALYKRIIQRLKQENVIRDFQIFVGQLVYGSMTKSKPPGANHAMLKKAEKTCSSHCVICFHHTLPAVRPPTPKIDRFRCL